MVSDIALKHKIICFYLLIPWKQSYLLYEEANKAYL